MERKMLFGLLTLVLVVTGIAGVIVTVTADGRGEQWCSKLTEQQRNELRLKMLELRSQAIREKWSREQFQSAVQELFRQYGITSHLNCGTGVWCR